MLFHFSNYWVSMFAVYVCRSANTYLRENGEKGIDLFTVIINKSVPINMQLLQLFGWFAFSMQWEETGHIDSTANSQAPCRTVSSIFLLVRHNSLLADTDSIEWPPSDLTDTGFYDAWNPTCRHLDRSWHLTDFVRLKNAPLAQRQPDFELWGLIWIRMPMKAIQTHWG